MAALLMLGSKIKWRAAKFDRYTGTPMSCPSEWYAFIMLNILTLFFADMHAVT